MKKFVVIYTICVITIAALAVALLKPESMTYTYGQHTDMLNEDWSAVKRINYCNANSLNPKRQVLYEGEFSVFINDPNAESPRLPILNPDTIKSIVGISSSIPFVMSPNAAKGDFYTNDIDPKWLSQQAKGKHSETLKVRYLMKIESITDLPSDLEADPALPLQVKVQTSSDSSVTPSKKASDSIIAKMSIANSSSLYSLIKADCLWIQQHIAYPLVENYEQYRSTYIFLKDPDKTVSLGLGIAHDNAGVLKKILEHQSVDSLLVNGYHPKSIKQSELMPSNYSNHTKVLVKSTNGYYFVDPTTQGSSSTKQMNLNKSTTITVMDVEDNHLLSYPMFPTEIEGYLLPPSYVSFDLKQVRLIR